MQNKCLLIIGHTWPEPRSTAAGNRMSHLLHFFLGQGSEIIFASTATKTNLSMNLEILGVQTETIRLNCDSFDLFIKELNPQIVLFDRFLTEEQFGWRVSEFAPDALRILDTEDLHSLRKSREMAFRSNRPFTTSQWLENEITKREIGSIYRCDLSLIISSHEMELLTKIIGINEALLLYLPFLLDEISLADQNAWPDFEFRKDFVFVGNGKHAPNEDAVLWLKQEIWPLVRKHLPEAKLNIYGSYFREHILQLHQPKEGFLIKGFSTNIQKTLQQARINLAPLRFGAGLKGKLTEAMQNGTPSVTTSIGAEAMYDGHSWSGRIADSPKDFAAAAVEMYTDAVAWKKAQDNGRAIVNDIYNKRKLEKALWNKIKALQSHLPAHRTDNFIGAVLHHHSMQSTKYFSKWIAGKNKGS